MVQDATPPKRQRRKEARPDEIIGAAFRELADKGYGGTTIASVAARSGIARSTVYLYFPDKEALVHRVFEDRIGAALSEVRAGVERQDAPFETGLAAMMTEILTRLVETDSVHLLRVLVAESGRFPDLAAFYHSRIISRVETLVLDMVGRAVRRGDVREDVLTLDLKVVIAPVIMAAVWHLAFDRIAPLDRDHLVKSAVSVICRGLAPR